MVATQHTLAIVSNRLPVSVSRTDDGELVFSPSSGGLATAMSSLDQEDMVWIGWPGIASDDLSADEKVEIEKELAQQGCYPVFLTNEEIELFYEGYANDTLWPLFHYFQGLARFDDSYWEAYRTVNQRYATAVETVTRADSLVWVHDYHLMLLPAYLRESSPGLSIGFFLHIPFPSFEIFRSLPERKELLEGLLGADLIGFHIYDYARHFLSSCLRLLGISSYQGRLEYGGRVIQTEAYPIGIDYAKFRKTLRLAETKRATSAIKDMYKNQRIMVSIDRLDYSKGIPGRLEALATLLERYPEYRGRIKLVMISVPSRTEVETYKQLRDQIEQTVSRINGEFGTVDWAPIPYQFQNRPFEEVVALYAAADIALVTPIRDGMNLVAKEYVASQGKDPGTLILSEMTGAADELPEAVLINPNDTDSIAEGIHAALKFSKRERQRRMSAMQKRLKSYDVRIWANDFLSGLKAAGNGRGTQLGKLLTVNEHEQLEADYAQASSRLILLDYDGTLKGFVATPNPLAVTPSLKLLWILRRLSKQPDTHVVIVSGRPKKVLARWFRGVNVDLAAEHGAWTRIDGKWTHVDVDFSKVKKKIRPLLERYLSRTSGSLVEEKEYATVWHYRNVSPELAYVRAQEIKRELVDLINDDSIGVFNGSKIVEIKPTSISKGRVADEFFGRYQPEFVLAAGDDYTDEDMFRELPDTAHTIKVGAGGTKAKHQLQGVKQMTDLLDELSKLMQ